MSDSADGNVDFKQSYFKCLEERDIARRDYEVMYRMCKGQEAAIKRLTERVQFIEPVYYSAVEVATWDWGAIFKRCDTGDGLSDVLALCKLLEGH